MSLSAIKNKSFIYLFSKVFAATINLFSIYLFTRLFKPNVYGDYLLFSSYVIFICSIVFWWHRLSVFRYYHKYKKNYNTYIKTSYLSFYGLSILLLFLFIIFIIFLSFYQSSFIEKKYYFLVIIIASIFRSNFDLNQNLLNINKDDYFYGTNVIIRPLLFFGICLSIHFFHSENNYVLIIGFIVSFFISSIYPNYYLQRNIKGGVFDRNIYKKFILYGLPLTGLFVFDYILAFSDRLLIGYFFGSEMVGVYGANYDLVKQIVLFLMIIQGLIIYPEINKLFEDGRLDEVNKLMSINLNLFISLFLPLAIFIAMFSDFISSVFIGERFTQSSGLLIPLLSIVFFILGIKIYHFDYIFHLKEKTKISMKILLIGSLINIFLNLLLVPNYKLIGAVLSTMIAYIFCLFLSIIFGKKYMLIKLDYNVFFRTIIFLFFSISICFLFSYFNIQIIFQIIVYILTYSFLTFYYNFDTIKWFLNRFN